MSFGLAGWRSAGIFDLDQMHDLGSDAIGDHEHCIRNISTEMYRFSAPRHVLNIVANRQLSTMPQQYVKRVTLFKVPKAEDIDEAGSIKVPRPLHKQLTT